MNEPVPFTVRRYPGVDVPIPTLAPLPRMRVFEFERFTLAPIAVAFVIVPFV